MLNDTKAQRDQAVPVFVAATSRRSRPRSTLMFVVPTSSALFVTPAHIKNAVVKVRSLPRGTIILSGDGG